MLVWPRLASCLFYSRRGFANNCSGAYSMRCVVGFHQNKSSSNLLLLRSDAISRLPLRLFIASCSCGLQFIPGAGKILDAGLSTSLLTPPSPLIHSSRLTLWVDADDPRQAQWPHPHIHQVKILKAPSEWWLSPCGGSDLVPDDIKKVFDILEQRCRWSLEL